MGKENKNQHSKRRSLNVKIVTENCPGVELKTTYVPCLMLGDLFFFFVSDGSDQSTG